MNRKEIENNNLTLSIENKKLEGKKILILLWFRSLIGGGLHENVRDTVSFIKNAGGTAIVVCPKSALSYDLSKEKISVYETNYEENLSLLKERIIQENESIDLIHVHPGPSRKLGELIADQIKKPVVITIHGEWFDSIDKNNTRYSRIFTVSGYIAQNLRQKMSKGAYKVDVIENAFDDSIFFPPDEKDLRLNQCLFVGRLDEDKRGSISLAYKIWEKQSSGEIPFCNWVVAGDGPLRNEIESTALKIFLGNDVVQFNGWLNRSDLSSLYKTSMLMIGAGRTCLEALACACPAIACEKNPQETPITNWDDYLNLSYSNFGGFGSQPTDSHGVYFYETILKSKKDFSLNLKIANHLKKTRSLSCISEKTITKYLEIINEYSH